MGSTEESVSVLGNGISETQTKLVVQEGYDDPMCHDSDYDIDMTIEPVIEVVSPGMTSDSQLNLGEEEADDLEEINFQKNDHTQKFSFNYNRSSCLSDKTPQLSYDANNAHSVAPGEGKFPSNILNETNWDIKTFPCLHPDGKNGLHEQRAVKLTPQNYFKQRLLNKNPVFASDTAYVFGAIGFVEFSQLQRNRDISFMRGVKTPAGNNRATNSIVISVF